MSYGVKDEYLYLMYNYIFILSYMEYVIGRAEEKDFWL